MDNLSVFCEQVYDVCRHVPKGKVTTYGAIAKKLKTSPRAVGQALKKNPYAPEVPCHRVVKSDGSIGGFMGHSEGREVERKVGLLRAEGVEISKNRVIGFYKHLEKSL